ncbi:MAG: 1-acyl-sn-glycerol-3-phosphate acyltransferase, partial [Myxococcales bacterium]|nr:1-acyl-sn-glycerol-3-phosphate acyltransferase [Myxococcales bacterium]
ALSGAIARGPIVFIARVVSGVDALAIAHLAARWQLPKIGFAHDLPAVPAMLLSARGGGHGADLTAALERGESAILFLKRPPSVFTTTGRARSEGDELLGALLAWARERERDVTLAPVEFLWSLSPGRQGLSPIDAILGPTDMPGDLRATAQLIGSFQHGALRMAPLVDTREFIASQPEGSTDYTLVRRLTYSLWRKLERERRAALGPVEKSPARLRDEVLRSSKLQRLIKDIAGDDEVKLAETEQRAREMLDALRASPNPNAMRAFEPVLDQLVRRVFSEVDVTGVEDVREASRKGTVVFLPCHKSHVDYIVLSYVLRKNLLELPVVAAGDNLSFFPVGEILRQGGAFFIRRDFRGDRLYAAVVDAYVRRLLRDGWALEFYLEGGRSRTGKLLAPKLGLLNLVVDAALSLEGRAISFVPVHIGYERLMEDFELAQEKAGAPKQRESYRSLYAVLDALRYDYGRVSVSFGRPIELDALRTELGVQNGAPTPAKRRAVTHKLAHLVGRTIHASARITAGALVATALLDMEGRGLLHPDLVARSTRLYETATRAGALPCSRLLHGDGRIREAAIRDAAILLVRGGLLREHAPDATLERSGKSRMPRSRDDVVYTVPEESRSRLDLSKNDILHFFADRSVIALAFRAARARRVDRARLAADALGLAQLLSFDLLSLADVETEARLAATLDDMIEVGELAALPDGTLALGAGSPEAEAAASMASHASHLVPMLESYRIAARALRLLIDQPLAEKDLVKQGLLIGGQMFLGGEIDRREAVSAPTISSALDAFLARGTIVRDKDRYKLGPDIDEAALKALDGYLLRHLTRTTGGFGGTIPAPPLSRAGDERP